MDAHGVGHSIGVASGDGPGGGRASLVELRCYGQHSELQPLDGRNLGFKFAPARHHPEVAGGGGTYTITASGRKNYGGC